MLAGWWEASALLGSFLPRRLGSKSVSGIKETTQPTFFLPAVWWRRFPHTETYAVFHFILRFRSVGPSGPSEIGLDTLLSCQGTQGMNCFTDTVRPGCTADIYQVNLRRAGWFVWVHVGGYEYKLAVSYKTFYMSHDKILSADWMFYFSLNTIYLLFKP